MRIYMSLNVYILPTLKLTFVQAVLNTVVYQMLLVYPMFLLTVLCCLSNRKRFPCLHSLIWTQEGLGEFETVMQTRARSRVCITVKNSPSPLSVDIRISKHGKKSCLLLKKTLLFRALIKREILTSREVLYTKLVRVISPCFSKKMLSKIRVFLA